MQFEKNDAYLMDVLTRAIKDLEKIEDDPDTMNFVARRVGNIVKHMKDLRDDMRPRGSANGNSHHRPVDDLTYAKTQPARSGA